MLDIEISNPEFINREYDIPTFRLPIMESRLEKLNKKAFKLGCDEGVITVISEPFIRQVVWNDEKYDIEFVTVSVSGQAPKLEGWTFVGYIDTEGLVYGDHIEDSERERQGECDYCGQVRARKHTFVITHDDGSRKVVGSSCLKDFFGGQSPDSIARWLTIFKDFTDDFRSNDFQDDYQFNTVQTLSYLLEGTRQMIRAFGWVSGGQAYQEMVTSTKDRVDTYLNGRGEERAKLVQAWLDAQRENDYPDTDPQLIEDAIEWAKSLKGDENNYLNNIGILGEQGYATGRQLGMAVSILPSYEKEVAKRIREEARKAIADASEHVGEIGKREVFDNVVLTEVKYIESQFGVSVLHKFNMDGNQLVWFGSRELGGVEIGDKISIKATVKRHDEFNGIPQTAINRVVAV